MVETNFWGCDEKVNCHAFCRFYDTHVGQYRCFLSISCSVKIDKFLKFWRLLSQNQKQLHSILYTVLDILSITHIFSRTNLTKLSDLSNWSGRLFFSWKPQVFCSEAFRSFSEANMFRRFRKVFDCLRAFENHKFLFKNFHQKYLVF